MLGVGRPLFCKCVVFWASGAWSNDDVLPRFFLQVIDEITDEKSDVKLDYPLFEDNFACVNTLFTQFDKRTIISEKFDAVIGNPPYGAFFSKNEKLELKKKYEDS